MGKYPWFPMFIDLSDKNVLVVGAGAVGSRRAAALARFCPRVTVIAPKISPSLEALAAEGRLTVYRRAFEFDDLDGRDMVLAASDDEALNAQIAAACRERGIPVNTSSDHSLCDFYFPGVVVDGEVAIGITASGSDHKRAKAITEWVRRSLPFLK